MWVRDHAAPGGGGDICRAFLNVVLGLVAWQPYKSKAPPAVYIVYLQFI